MTVTALPFKAVLLACPNEHYEATTQDERWMRGKATVCARCNKSLRLVKTVTIWPGSRR